jgi:hypothetical protein
MDHMREPAGAITCIEGDVNPGCSLDLHSDSVQALHARGEAFLLGRCSIIDPDFIGGTDASLSRGGWEAAA